MWTSALESPETHARCGLRRDARKTGSRGRGGRLRCAACGPASVPPWPSWPAAGRPDPRASPP
ncbi:MAG: hypothetical protein DI587_19100 [Variovorax paradoxus]|nr:MAG: hypothetical protein DI583_19100 [Variovorax paradoxus]PZQ07806.1 MAG: hypothetical protein DI587_19100 [Variovorax paradoxus]